MEKITKYVYILRGSDAGSQPYVSDVLHDSPNEFEHLASLGLDILTVIELNFDLSRYETVSE